MNNVIPFRTIYVDSRFCTKDSVSSSNLKVEFPITAQVSDNTVFFITDVCVSHTWLTAEQHFNDKLYLTLLTTSTGVYSNCTTTPIADYYNMTTFIAELQWALRASPGGFTVTADTNNSNGAVIYIASDNYTSKFATDGDLINDRYWTGDRLGQDSINSANDIINKTVSINTLNDTRMPFKTGCLSLNWLNNIFITSPSLGSFDTILAGQGSENIIETVPVLVNYGYMVIDQLMSTNDFLDCSRQTLQTIEFRLKTAKGEYVPLRGNHVSFSSGFNI